MPEVPSMELAAPDVAGLDRLARPPIIDRVDRRTLALIKDQVAKSCTDAEVGYFLELAAHYDLDPFAHEIWCAKDKKGRLLIMVGRDGLRKIAQREGFYIDGDVVHERDTFRVIRERGVRDIVHHYDGFGERGPIAGAWCQVRDRHGVERGYFFAPLSEYRPQGVSEYSPWSKQTSVMILAAAERQALRQATPLSGLLAEGEDESANAIGTGVGNGEAPGWGTTSVESAAVVEGIVERAKALGHAGLSDIATAQVGLAGQSDEVIRQWCERAARELDDFEAQQVARAENWQIKPEPDVERGPQTEAERDEVQARLDRVLDRITEEQDAGADEGVLAPLYEEEEKLRRMLGENPEQGALDL